MKVQWVLAGLVRLLALALTLAALPAAYAEARAQPLTVFAAASLKNALDAIGAAFTEETGVAVVFSYAGTSALARQIEQGAPADVFASAHEDWMAYLAERRMVEGAGVVAFAGNRLVLIAHQDRLFGVPPDPASARDLLALLGADGRLAVALVDAVPAGIYAREAMQALGTWEGLAPRLAQTDNVRAALLLVARQEAPLGIVYATDARAEPRVRVAAVFPQGSHSVIRYTAGRVARSENPHAERFLAFLMGSSAQVLLREQGFAAGG